MVLEKVTSCRQILKERQKMKTYYIQVRHTFIAPNTAYFSAASATLKNRLGSIFITDGWRYPAASDGGSINWKRISKTSDVSGRGTVSRKSIDTGPGDKTALAVFRWVE